MTLALSTSSQVASVALIDAHSHLLWSASEDAPRRAGGACLAMIRRALDELGVSLGAFQLFAADVGPGSFTGVRVGVTLAKTFAFLHSRPVAGASAFDLIDSTKTVVLPSRKDEFFVREIGRDLYRSRNLPEGGYSGYGSGITNPAFPSAAAFARILDALQPVSAEEFVPEYVLEPSISIPKKPFSVT